MSTFTCPVVRIGEHHKHPNADTLRVTEVEGSTCIFKDGAFQTGDLALFIPVEAMVPLEHEAFAWLRDPQRPAKTHYHVKAKKLRGVFSDGFLTPVTELYPGAGPCDHTPSLNVVYWKMLDKDGDIFIVLEGTDLAPRLKIEKFVEELPGVSMGKQIAEPYGPEDVPVYDIEAWKKNKSVFTNPDEEVVISEKIHGVNSRFIYREGQLWVGSRNRFVRMDETNLWWKIAKNYKLEEILAANPELVVYGETYGVQDLKYDCEPGNAKFVVFDIYDTKTRSYMNFGETEGFCLEYGLPMVPILYQGKIGDQSIIENLTNPETEGHVFKTKLGESCIREGVVIKPVIERWNEYTHRTILKHISKVYLLRKNGTEAH